MEVGVVANVCCFVAFMYFLAVVFKKIFREGCHENLAMKIGLVYILMTFRDYLSLSYWNGTVHCAWDSHCENATAQRCGRKGSQRLVSQGPKVGPRVITTAVPKLPVNPVST